MKNEVKVFFWGSGNIAHQVNDSFRDIISQMNVAGYIDNDKSKVGKLFCGKMVFLPEILLQERNCFIIVVNDMFEEVKKQIEANYPWQVDKTEHYFYFLKKRILSRYSVSEDAEIQKICKYLEKNPLQVFNYPFTLKYKNQPINIEFDIDKKLYYTYLYHIKMYFARSYKTQESAIQYCRQVLMEQDAESPHKYLFERFNVCEGDVVVDAGVAEGNFALSIINKVKKIYLFEPDVEWAEALGYTFEPYKEKVVIINKYLSDFVSADTTTIDACVEEDINFIKMDIEGEEYYALKGARNIISTSANLKCAVSIYHNEFDKVAVEQIMNEYDLNTQISNGYMWFPYDKDIVYSLPTLRKAILWAER